MHAATSEPEFEPKEELINMERPRGMNGVKTGGGRTLCIHYTSGRRTVRLGSLQGLYERFLIRNLIRQLQSHAGVYSRGPLQCTYSMADTQAGLYSRGPLQCTEWDCKLGSTLCSSPSQRSPTQPDQAFDSVIVIKVGKKVLIIQKVCALWLFS